jgi:GMP synthase (glutamine-hydrolysing)
MSHFDEVKQLPKKFETIATSGNCIAAIENQSANIYAIQFHPEVSHSQEGNKILKNFLFNICKAKKDWTVKNNVAQKIETLKKQVGNNKVVIGLSGGVDSTVAAILLQKAIGKNLTCIFVNNGLLRLNEAENVLKVYGKHLKLNIVYADASQLFIKALKGVSNPEEKRKIIGKLFIDIFAKEAKKLNGIKYLAQGTIYPDVIESSSHNGNSVTIKTHHNVGGLPKNLNFELVEPLRDLFKDEVRKIGVELGIDKELVYRHPFPGPGLAVRILGDITQEKINILQQADNIFITELVKHNYYYKSSQAFVVLLPVKTVGVMGDERTYEFTVAIRCVDTTDFMTASFSHLPFSFLEMVSTRIINEVKNINRVVYDISNKPPATIEWE